MTNEEAKQQSIINAYGEYWHEVKSQVDENGWVTWKVVSHGVTNNLHPEEDFNLPFGFYQTKNDYGCGKFEWRPLSLQGIENNNGWIKIESENDLPKDKNIIDFWVFDGEEIVIAKFIHESQTWWDKLDLNFRLFPSHYQKIIKPKPPIY